MTEARAIEAHAVAIAVTDRTGTPHSAPSAGGWLDPSRSAWLALVLGAIPGAALAFVAAAGWLDPTIALVLFVPSYVGLNAMHMAATWSRTYLAPGFAAARPIERIAIPFGIAAAALATEAVGGAVILFGLQYYLSVHHAAMQNYGLARASQRAAGREAVGRFGALQARVAQGACLLPLLAALAYRAREICAVYDAAPLVAPPVLLVELLAGAAVVAVAAFVASEVAARLRGEAVDALSIAVVLAVTATWVALIVFVEHPVLPFFALASGHYIQYLWVASRAERRRDGALALLPQGLRDRVHPARSNAAHLVFLAVVGLTGIAAATAVAVGVRAGALALHLRPHDAMPLPAWGAAMLAVNLHHYWLDHRIWRSTPNPAGA